MTAIAAAGQSAADRQADKVTPDFEAQVDEIVTHYPSPAKRLHSHFCIFGKITLALSMTVASSGSAAKLDPPARQYLRTRHLLPPCSAAIPRARPSSAFRTLACALAGSYEVKGKFCQAVGLDPHDHHHRLRCRAANHGDGQVQRRVRRVPRLLRLRTRRPHQRRPVRTHHPRLRGQSLVEKFQ